MILTLFINDLRILLSDHQRALQIFCKDLADVLSKLDIAINNL